MCPWKGRAFSNAVLSFLLKELSCLIGQHSAVQAYPYDDAQLVWLHIL